MDALPLPGSVVFLHLPKTAGQSVHQFLENLFGAESVAPARMNAALLRMSIPEIRQYRVLSGHLDWLLLDCVAAPKFVFTVLRDPLERILSFYFFLRREAANLPPKRLTWPANRGIAASLQLPCDAFFLGADAGLRGFLDNQFDNIYSFYFAGRAYDTRPRLLAQQQANVTFTDARIVRMALDNLATLDGVYRVDGLQRLDDDLRAFALRHGADRAHVAAVPPLVGRQVNIGDGMDVAARLEALRQLGATEETFARLREMTEMDDAIWRAQRIG